MGSKKNKSSTTSADKAAPKAAAPETDTKKGKGKYEPTAEQLAERKAKREAGDKLREEQKQKDCEQLRTTVDGIERLAKLVSSGIATGQDVATEYAALKEKTDALKKEVNHLYLYLPAAKEKKAAKA